MDEQLQQLSGSLTELEGSLTGLAENAGVNQEPVTPSLELSQVEEAQNIQPQPDVAQGSSQALINQIANATSVFGGEREGQVTQEQDELAELVKGLEGKSAETARLTEQAGIPDLEAEIRDIGTDIQKRRAGLTQQLAGMEAQGRLSFATRGRAARANRQAAAEIEGLSAAQAAAQGQLITAQSAVQRAVEAKYGPIQEQIDIQKQLIEVRKDQMTLEQQKRAEKREAELTKLEAQIQQAQQRESRGYEAVNTAIQNGYSPAKASKLMTQIANGEIQPEEAIAQLGSFAGDIWGNELKRLQIQKVKQDLSQSGSGAGKLTASQSAALGYGERLLQSSMIIDEIGRDFTGVSSRFAGFLPGGLKSSDRQRFEQAQRNFVNAVLRRESGAAISPEEFESAQIQYFPQPGDKQAVLIQKKQNRDLVTKNLLREAGVDTSPQDNSLNDPLDIGITSENINPLDL